MQDLIKNTLENEFDENRFSGFVKNLFNEITITPQNLIVTGGFSQHIKSFNFLGEINDAEKKRLDILTVELSGDTKVARARSMQRNIISKYLKDNLCDAALVAFYSKDNPDWRLSFVKMEYKLTDKGAKVEIGTPPKRFSFLVGKTEPSHTAGGQLLPILKEQKVNPLVSDIEDAFSIEKVTKEFFVKYKQLFTSLDQQLEKNHTFQNEAVRNNIDAANFAKKLLGQIVFLYFLQKKGWLGVSKGETWGSGDKHFLRSLFITCLEKSKNFFNDYLEFLFYDTLNNPRNDQADRNYSARFDCKIPFLNGGLFEPEYDWQSSFIYLDNKIFADIFDVFDLYNFTVKEDEPLEKEVAVDPEMLGKVFENLLEENLRKGKGTYYTPREIVHYMCQESLANYIATETKIDIEDIRDLIRHISDNGSELSNVIVNDAKSIDKALAGIKVVDPACGSGAFCVGMLQEIIKARLLLNPALSEYQIKKETIQNCIYGVDIDPGAIEIAKLRLWLSLVVDYDLEDIEPLPNLDYKIMQGNSLLEELVLGEKTIKLFDPVAIGIKSPKYLNLFEEDSRLSLFDQDETTKEIFENYHKWQIKLFNAKTIEKKKEARGNLEKIQTELIEKTIKSEISHLDVADKNIGNYVSPGVGLTKEDADKKADILNTQSKINEILNDIKTTGNRPFFLWHLYFGDVFLEKGGFDVVIANPPYNAKLSDRERKEFKVKFESVKRGRQDTAAIFVELARRIGNPQMELSYILPYRLFSRKRNHGQFQIYTLHNYSIRKILYLGSDIGFSASDEFMILLMTAKGIGANEIEVAFKPDFMNLDLVGFLKLQQGQFTERAEINLNLIRFDPNLISKIEKETLTLETICNVKDGIVPFLRDKLISTNRLDERYVRFAGIAGKYILQKYYFDCEKLYLCYDINEAKKYIKDPVELRKVQLRDKDIFLQRKILTAQNSSTLKGAIDDNKTFVSNSLHSTYLRDEYQNKFFLEYILALMNSKLLNYYHNSLRLKAIDLHPQILVTNLKKLPIRNIAISAQRPIIDFVNAIQSVTNSDDYLENPAKQAKVREYEHQVDQMVNKFYDLTDEEIAIVEGTNE